MANLLDQLTAALKLSGEAREALIAAMRQAKLTERDPEIVPITLVLALRRDIEQSRGELARLENSIRANVDREQDVANMLLQALQSPARIDRAIRMVDAETERACRCIAESGQKLEQEIKKLNVLVSAARWRSWSIPVAMGITAAIVTMATYFSPGVSGYLFLRERVAAELVPGCTPVTPSVNIASNGVKYVACR